MLGVTATIPVGTSPRDVAFSPDGTHAYVANTVGHTVSVIDTTAKTVTATIGLASDFHPRWVVVHPDGTRLYVSRGFGTLAVIDTATHAVIADISVGDQPNSSLAIHPDGTRLYAAGGYEDGTVSVINTVTNTIDATIGVDYPYRLAVSTDGTRLYATRTATLIVMSTSTNSVVDTIDIGGHPESLAVSPDGTRVYVTDVTTAPYTVTVVNVANGTVTATIPFGGWQPTGIGVHPDGSRLYVPDLYGLVSVIDTTTDAVTEAIQVGTNASGVAVSPDGASIYVPRYDGNAVSVLSNVPSWQWPGHLPELVGDLFGGAASDGGGWLVIGGHFYPIPPRPLDIAIIARAAAPYLGKPIENRELGQRLRNMLRR